MAYGDTPQSSSPAGFAPSLKLCIWIDRNAVRKPLPVPASEDASRSMVPRGRRFPEQTFTARFVAKLDAPCIAGTAP